MEIIILYVSIAILFLFIVLSHKLHADGLKRIHNDVRKTREALFWSQRREREARRILREYGKA